MKQPEQQRTLSTGHDDEMALHGEGQEAYRGVYRSMLLSVEETSRVPPHGRG